MPTPAIIYVGTREGLAIYRAETGGLRRTGHTLAGAAVQAIVAVDALTLLAAVEGRPAQQSFDGGASWSDAAGPPPEPIGLQAATVQGPAPLAYPRLRGATAYARLRGKPATLLGAGAGGSQLFRSDDDGIHWQPASIAGEAPGRITTIVPDAGRRDSAWAGTEAGALLRTGDRGRSWRVVAREPAVILSLAVPAPAGE
jgi:hypothetical protein